MKILFANIKNLLQVHERGILKLSGVEMKELPTIKNTWLLIENGKIIDCSEEMGKPPIWKLQTPIIM